jgi:hypothetical protein
MRRVTFEELPKLARIGERAFANSKLSSITIRALAEKVDGFAFLDCPLREIRVARASRTFMILKNMPLTLDDTEIVESLGSEANVIISSNVKVLRTSCCQSANRFEAVVSE